MTDWYAEVDSMIRERGTKTRLAVLREQLQACTNQEEIAKLLWIVCEGIHEGYYQTVNFTRDQYGIRLRLEMNSPPWRALLERNIP